jgi:peptidoglycan/xylan/chitin deacetylase (PgdA/CDA1 family)
VGGPEKRRAGHAIIIEQISTGEVSFMNIGFGFYPGGKKKALTMSYDDGQVHDRKLVEIFNRYGIRGTFHLNSGRFDTDVFLKSTEIRDLFEGHEISAHTLNHPYLTILPGDMVATEVLEDRKNLEELAGYPVRGMSYPFGAYSQELVEILPFLGIEYCRTVNSHFGFQLPDDFLAWHPTCHHKQGLMEKAEAFRKIGKWAQMPLLYVWGHSFEFEWDKNWDLVEEFCKTVSGDEDVWYATNIEIADYVKAMKSLKFSVDRKIVHNPSAQDVWISVDGEPCRIEAGKTVRL